MRFKILFLFFVIFNIALIANAQELSRQDSVINAYRSYKDIDYISINAPTVVEVPFADEFIERSEFIILDKTTNFFEPYFLKQEMLLIGKTPVSISANPDNNTASQMNDNNTQTYADFSLPDDAQGQVQITLLGASPIISSALTVILDANVALPSFVEIRAFINGQNRIVVANRKMDQQTVYFPQTASNKWLITFTFAQPLRISELQLNQDHIKGLNTHDVRFLAQPSHSYRVYFNPDRVASAPVGEMGNLIFAENIFVIPAISQKNSKYVVADVDNDGVPDINDNCVFITNSNQQDINNNKRGDACDDFDQDGIINSKDNCLNNPNRAQEDLDSDNIGNVCDKEESRITERHVWVPWVGIGFAAIVLIVLFALTARQKK